MENIKHKISRDGQILSYYEESKRKKASEENYFVHEPINLTNSLTYVTTGGSLSEEMRRKVIPVLDTKEYKNRRGQYIVCEMTHPDPRTGQTIGIGRLGYPSTDVFWDSHSGIRYPIINLEGDGLPFPAKVGGDCMMIAGDSEGMVSEQLTEQLPELSPEMRKLLVA